MNYKVLKEHPTHFDVHDGKSQFRVAKNGLSEAMLGKIRKYSQGGDVTADPSAESDDSDYISSAMNTLIPAGARSEQPPQSASDVSAAQDMPSQQQEAQDVLQNFRHGAKVLAGGPLAWGRAAGLNPGFEENGQFKPVGVTDEPASSMAQAPAAMPASAMQANPDQAPVAQAAAAPGQAAQQSGLNSELENSQNAMISGVKGIANAKQQESQQVSDYWKQYQQSLAAQQQMTDKALAENEAHGQALQQSIMDGKVDPHRLWNDTSTGNKVIAGISLLLGGMGAGLTHGPNQALAVMENAINRDVEAQKFNMNKQETLYGYNLKKYGDIRAADTATKVQLGTVLQAQIAQAAAQSGSQQAQANAQMMIGEIHQKMIPYKMQLAQLQSQAVVHQVGGIPEHSPIDQQQMVLNPKYGETRVPIGGKVFQARDKEAATKLNDVESLAGPIMDGINTLSQLGPAAAIPGTKENQIAEGIRGDLAVKLPLMSGAEIGAKRVNGEEIKHQLDRIKDPTSFKQMVNGGVKNEEFFKGLANELESMREHNLLNYRGMGSIQGRNQGFK